MDNDGSVCAGEVFDCVVMAENEFRATNCPDYPMIACENPFPCVECDGAWTCEDIYYISVEVMSMDTNSDG